MQSTPPFPPASLVIPKSLSERRHEWLEALLLLLYQYVKQKERILIVTMQDELVALYENISTKAINGGMASEFERTVENIRHDIKPEILKKFFLQHLRIIPGTLIKDGTGWFLDDIDQMIRKFPHL